MKIELTDRESEELTKLLDWAVSCQRAIDCDRDACHDIAHKLNDARWEE